MKNQIIRDFGYEWKKYSHNQSNLKNVRSIFFKYFFDKRLFKKKYNTMLDLGCGSGRWSYFASQYTQKLICCDGSIEALRVAKKNLKDKKNVSFVKSSIENLKLKKKVDFCFSLGVIHHTENPKKNLIKVYNLLDKKGIFLLYFYYDLDNKSKFYKIIWKFSNFFRFFISKLPNIFKYIVCLIIAIFIYFPLARIAKILHFFKLDIKNFPLNFYKDKNFYTMKNDALDRFGTRLEHRWSRKKIKKELLKVGFNKVVFSNKEPFHTCYAIK